MNLIDILLNIEFFGTDLFNKDFYELVIKLLFNLAIVSYIVRYLYYNSTKNKDYLFTYLMISITVFLLCFLLENVKLQLGFALGLFAIFGIIRYRTDPIPIKEMTYLFIVIGISIMNALANKKISYSELLFANLSIRGLIRSIASFVILNFFPEFNDESLLIISSEDIFCMYCELSQSSFSKSNLAPLFPTDLISNEPNRSAKE